MVAGQEAALSLPRYTFSAGPRKSITSPLDVLTTPAARKAATSGSSSGTAQYTLCTSCPLAFVLAGPIARLVSMRAYLKTSNLWQARASPAVPDESTTVLYYLATTKSGGAVHGALRFRKRGMLTSGTFGL